MAVSSALVGYGPEELRAILDLPPYRATQIFKWISRGVGSFQDMTDLSLDLRRRLTESCQIYSTEEEVRLKDRDGTEKIRIRLNTGEAVEAALLLDRSGRRTACLSTQAGCPMGCVFCKTGSMGLLKNLDAGEIVEQFLHLRSAGSLLKPKAEHPDPIDIDNIVLMGMGEPLLNLIPLRQALGVLMDPRGMSFSRRRITISTSGVIAGIRDLADNGPDVRLAVSLTTAEGALREKLMPVAKANPLPALREAIRYYQAKTRRRVTLELVLLGGINTRPADLDALKDFMEGLKAAVNLIPWNSVPGLCFEGVPLQEPTRQELAAFNAGLLARGIRVVTQRVSRGRAISGACGQLGSSH